MSITEFNQYTYMYILASWAQITITSHKMLLKLYLEITTMNPQELTTNIQHQAKPHSVFFWRNQILSSIEQDYAIDYKYID